MTVIVKFVFTIRDPPRALTAPTRIRYFEFRDSAG